MDQDLTIKEGYITMLLYLENSYKLTNSDDLGGLLGGMQFAPDGDTMDPAAWDDWLDIIAGCKKISRKKLSETNTVLAVQESFMAVVAYLEFLCTLIESEDLCNFLSKMKSSLDKGPSSSSIWKDFLGAVKKVKTTPIEKLIEENTIKFS